MSLSQEDYGVIMGILNENMNEGLPPPQTSAKSSAALDAASSQNEPSEQTGVQKVVVEVEQSQQHPVTAPKEASPVRMQFDFRFDGIQAMLFMVGRFSGNLSHSAQLTVDMTLLLLLMCSMPMV